MKLIRVGVPVAVSALLLAGCGGDGNGDAEETISVTTSETPVAEPEEVDPVEAESLYETVEDPGLNVEWTYQGANYGTNGGTVITLAVKNLNEEPLPPDAIEPPTLTRSDGMGGTVDVELMDDDTSGITSGLDLPLGSQAITNIRYAFEDGPGLLWDAELQVGNVIFAGNLNI